MKAWFASLLDTRNRAAELHLLLSFAGGVVYLILWVHVVMMKWQPFDGMAFGGGLGALMAGTGLASMTQAFGRRAENGDAHDSGMAARTP